MEVYVDAMLVKLKKTQNHVAMLVKLKKTQDHVAYLAEISDILWKFQMKLNTLMCAFRVGSRKFLGFMVNHRSIEANLEEI